MKHANTVSLALLCGAMNAGAAFTLVDTFDSYALNSDIGDATNWTASNASGKAIVVADPAGGTNQVLSVTGGIGNTVGAKNSLATVSIAEGDTGTLYFRLRGTDAAVDYGHSFGLLRTGAGTPDDFDVFGAQAFVNRENGDEIANGDIAIGGRTGGTNTGFGTLKPEIWYDMWIVANTSSDTNTLYVQGGAFTSQTNLGSFGYRSGTPTGNGLSEFGVIAGSNGETGLLFDNIAIDQTAQNLNVPIPEPSAALLGLVGCILLARRRR